MSIHRFNNNYSCHMTRCRMLSFSDVVLQVSDRALGWSERDHDLRAFFDMEHFHFSMQHGIIAHSSILRTARLIRNSRRPPLIHGIVWHPTIAAAQGSTARLSEFSRHDVVENRVPCTVQIEHNSRKRKQVQGALQSEFRLLWLVAEDGPKSDHPKRKQADEEEDYDGYQHVDDLPPGVLSSGVVSEGHGWSLLIWVCVAYQPPAYHGVKHDQNSTRNDEESRYRG